MVKPKKLFDADVEILKNKTTDKALTGAWNISPGDVGHIFHNFSRGRCFNLIATNSDHLSDYTNAFLARVSVAPPFKK